MAAPAQSPVSSALPRIQRYMTQPSMAAGVAPASVHRVLASPGRPLELGLRQDMEQRFGHDFSQVRVHTGSAAEQSAREVNANAYTVGHDIVFGGGRFAPTSNAGQRLIAHELTHVMQQSASRRRVDSNNENRSLSPVSVIADNCRPTTPLHGIAAPSLQRAPSGDGESSYEAGAIGSLQFCIDFCTGNFEVLGWIWVGGGKRVFKVFVGPSAMYEGTIAKGNEPSLGLLKSICGECDPECDVKKGYFGDSGVAPGIPFFSDLVKGGKQIRLASLECGVLIVPHSKCNVDVELICFANLLPYMGAVGKALSTFASKIKAEAKAGIDGGVTLEFCKGADGNWVMPKAQVCLGAFVEFGWVKETPPGKSPPKKSAPSKDAAPALPAPPKAPDVEPLDPKLIS
ncbi:DUF4157 domain-containing protein [Azotobacter chroococcum]|uniref:DUF4157 domain-containing protein n=2 Tax=Azotobacter chroococcum TaxID=353 RepID=A0AA43ZBM8_9GAMM|nr:DUF4157 domain-containing protein [Azotobacter chroococcum]